MEKLIRLTFKDVIDMKVPENFIFKCKMMVTENLQEDETYRVKGKYDYHGDIDLTAEQILKHWFPKDSYFEMKKLTSNERGDEISTLIPLLSLECEYVSE